MVQFASGAEGAFSPHESLAGGVGSCALGSRLVSAPCVPPIAGFESKQCAVPRVPKLPELM